MIYIETIEHKKASPNRKQQIQGTVYIEIIKARSDILTLHIDRLAGGKTPELDRLCRAMKICQVTPRYQHGGSRFGGKKSITDAIIDLQKKLDKFEKRENKKDNKGPLPMWSEGEITMLNSVILTIYDEWIRQKHGQITVTNTMTPFANKLSSESVIIQNRMKGIEWDPGMDMLKNYVEQNTATYQSFQHFYNENIVAIHTMNMRVIAPAPVNKKSRDYLNYNYNMEEALSMTGCKEVYDTIPFKINIPGEMPKPYCKDTQEQKYHNLLKTLKDKYDLLHIY